MTQLPIDQAIPRFAANEERVDVFVNDPSSTGYYETNGTAPRQVETLPHLIDRIAARHLNVVFKGDWLTTTSYSVNDLVEETDVVYICVESHTSGVFATDLSAGKWAVYQGNNSSNITHTQPFTGATQLTVEGKLAEWVSVTDFGADPTGVENSTEAIQKAIAASKHIYFPDGIYKTGFETAPTASQGLFVFDSLKGITIYGPGAYIKDITENTGDWLVNVFEFINCEDIIIDINVEGTLIDPISSATFRALSAFYFEKDCKNIHIRSSVKSLRYGVRAADYSNIAYQGSKDFVLDLNSYEVGYPIALYGSDNVRINLVSEIQRRCCYLSGCANVTGTIYTKGYTLGQMSVILSSQLTVASEVDADRRAKGCQNIDLNVFAVDNDNPLSERAVCGISAAWKAPDTVFRDIKLNINAKTNDTIRTLSAFRIENNLGWMSSNRLENITISGVIDRIDQTLAGGGWGNFNISCINSGETTPYPNSPVVSNLNFDNFTVLNSAITGNFDYLSIPQVWGYVTFKDYTNYNTTVITAESGKIICDNARMGTISTLASVNDIRFFNSEVTSFSGTINYQINDFTGGAFTPVIFGGTTAGVGTYTLQHGKYSIVGNVCHFCLAVGISSHTGSGNFKIGGLPFQSKAGNFTPVSALTANVSAPTDSIVHAMIPNNESNINLYSITTGTSGFATLALDVACSLYISGSYFIS